MYPTWLSTEHVTGGRLEVALTRFWLSGFIVVPASDSAGFAALTATDSRAPPHAGQGDHRPEGVAGALVGADDAHIEERKRQLPESHRDIPRLPP
jgi:hypothetical protein